MKTTMLIASAILLCCAQQTTAQNQPAQETFLFISDIHLDNKTSSTDYGYDIGTKLWEAFISKIDKLLGGANAPKFIVCTGDLPKHSGWCGTPMPKGKGEREKHNDNIDTVLERLRKVAAKYNKPLVYLPGNNDPLAGDYASFADKYDNTPFSLVSQAANPYPAPNTNAIGGPVPCMVSNPYPKQGFYSVSPVKGLRIIMLNTVMYSSCYEPADGSTAKKDGGLQMDWLAAQLNDAANKGEKAYIAMHIPPGIAAVSGNPTWVQDDNNWLHRFLATVQLNSGTIAGILYGHTHMDELRRLYDTTSAYITEVAISCPAISPYYKNNPGFKIVTYDSQTKELMDFTTHYTKPDDKTWGYRTYQFNNEFGFSSSNTMYENIISDSPYVITKKLKKIFRVKHEKASYDIGRGVEVKVDE